MIPLTLRQIAEITGGTVHGDDGIVVDAPATLDSRAAEPGGLFVAIFVLGTLVDDPAEAPSVLSVLPVSLVAIRFGALGGVGQFHPRPVRPQKRPMKGVAGAAGIHDAGHGERLRPPMRPPGWPRWPGTCSSPPV